MAEEEVFCQLNNLQFSSDQEGFALVNQKKHVKATLLSGSDTHYPLDKFIPVLLFMNTLQYIYFRRLQVPGCIVIPVFCSSNTEIVIATY